MVPRTEPRRRRGCHPVASASTALRRHSDAPFDRGLRELNARPTLPSDDDLGARNRMESRAHAADRPVQKSRHAVACEETLTDLDMHFRHDHVLDLDDRDLLQRATAETQQHNHGPDPTRAHHQKCTSKPKVGRIGNMETPERVAGERSYS